MPMNNESVEIPIELTIKDLKTGNLDLSKLKKEVVSQASDIAEQMKKVFQAEGSIGASPEQLQIYTELRQAVQRFVDTLNNATKSSDSFKNTETAIVQKTAELNATQLEYNRSLEKAVQLEAAWEEGNNRVIGSNPLEAWTDYNKAISNVDALRGKIGTLKQEIADLKVFVNQNKLSWVAEGEDSKLHAIISSIGNLNQATEQASAFVERFGSDSSIAMNSAETDVRNLTKEYDSATTKLETLQAKIAKWSDLGKGSESAWREMEYDVQTYIDKIMESGEVLGKSSGELDTYRNIAENCFEIITERLGEFVDTEDESIKKASRFKPIISELSKLGSATLKTAGNLISKINSGLSNMISKLKNIRVHTKGSSIDVDRLARKFTKFITQFVLGFRSAYFLIKKIRTTFISMFKAMAEQIPEINVQLSSFLTALNQIKGSVVTAFQPIVSFAIPALVKLSKTFEDVLNGIGEFFAVLTGQGYIYKYTAATIDYAKEQQENSSETKAIEAAKKKVQDAKDDIAKFYDDEADAEENANKKAKEYQKTLLGFDEINRLNAPEEDDDEEADKLKDRTDALDKLLDKLAEAEKELAELEAYDPTKVAGGVWEKVPLTNEIAQNLAIKLKNLIDRIKELWKSGADFTELGKDFSKKLTKFLDKLTLLIQTEIKNRAIKLANALATFLNGFLSQDLAKSIGKFAASLVNTVQSTINHFFETFDWHNLGRFLATSLNTAIKNWDAKGFGKMIANAIVAAVKTWWTFVNPNEGFDFEQLGLKLADAFNGFMDKSFEIDPETGLNMWEEMGQSISNSILGVLTTLNTFFDESDTDKVGKAIADVFNNIKWKEIWFKFKKLVKTIGKAIINAFKTHWETANFSTKVGTILATAFLAINLITVLNPFALKLVATLASLIIKGLTGAISFIASAIWGGLVKLGGLLFAKVGEIAASLGIPFTTALTGIVMIVGGVIASVTSFIEQLKGGFDIVKTVIMGIGDALIAIGLFMLGLVSGPVAILIAAVTFAVQQVIINWESIKEAHAIITDAISDKMLELEKKLKETLNSAKENWNQTKEDFKTSWEDLKTTIFDIWEKIKQKAKLWSDSVNETWSEIGTFWSDAWDGLKTNASETWEDIKKDFKDFTDKIQTNAELWCESVNETWSEIGTFWSDTWEGVKTTTSDIWEGIKSIIKDGINWIVDTFNSWISSAADKINTFIDLINSVSFGDKHLNINHIEPPQIPGLAKGAVIPPNKEFLAMLGDQKSGTNIEAPLSTIQDAVSSVISEQMENAAYQAFVRALKDSGSTYTFVAQLNGKTLFEEVVKQNKSSVKSFGISPLSAY